MKKVMTVAWKLARKGQKNFGGKVSEYLSQALKMAWQIVGPVKRVSKKATIVTSAGSRKHKSWIAKITGTHAQYKFNRSFVDSVDHNMIERTFELESGIYEICDAGERRFVKVVAGKVVEIEEGKVKGMVA